MENGEQHFLVSLISKEGLVLKVLSKKLKRLSNNSEEREGVYRNEFCGRRVDSKLQKIFKICIT